MIDRQLEEYILNNKFKVIAIDGPSGSGKSSLAKILEDKYDCLVFHTDDYFLHPSRKTFERLNEPGGNLDYERMLLEIFSNLDKELITSNHFNCMTNIIENREPFLKKNMIVIEGVYSLHPLFQKFYDYKVYLDVSKEVQLNRILERSGADMLKRFKEEWIPLENKYFEVLNIKDIVDIIIRN